MAKRPLIFVRASKGGVVIETRSTDTVLTLELAQSLVDALQRTIVLQIAATHKVKR